MLTQRLVAFQGARSHDSGAVRYASVILALIVGLPPPQLAHNMRDSTLIILMFLALL